jgi:hypothetical protein
VPRRVAGAEHVLAGCEMATLDGQLLEAGLRAARQRHVAFELAYEVRGLSPDGRCAAPYRENMAGRRSVFFRTMTPSLAPWRSAGSRNPRSSSPALCR